MSNEKHQKLSRFISFVLRHKPEAINLHMDQNGYVNVNELINKTNNTKYVINKLILNELIESDSKDRYSYDSTGTKIRANQGHSVKVNLELKEQIPPETLYHGTSVTKADSILSQGVLKMDRHHVHLSEDINTASDVGRRHGELALFKINTKEMLADGHKFYLSNNGVWLTDEVPVKFISK